MFRLFKSPVLNNFLYEAVNKLILAIPEEYREHVHFLRVMQHLIAFVWNRKGQDCPLLKRAFLLHVADTFGNMATFPGWELLMDNVLKRYRAREAFGDFEVPEMEMDAALLRVLKGADELLPFVDNWISLLVIGHGSAPGSPIERVMTSADGHSVADDSATTRSSRKLKKKKSCNIA
jgi:hypothetical protein